MPTKRILAALIVLLAVASISANATVKVTNLHMVKNGQFTELTVATDGKCEFTHQIVEEAANKPYRIVVDIKDAVHGLPQHAFANLPIGMVRQIRTSQFSTDPEKIVRVVIDAVGSLTYKVKSGDNGVTLFINTPSDKDFPLWSAVAGGPAPTLVNNDPPASMPAFPGNEQNAPKIDKSDPAKADLKVASKPIDEGKLLNKPKSDSTTPQSTVAVITPTTKPTQPEQPKTEPVEKKEVVESKPVAVAPTQVEAPKPAVKIDPNLLTAIYGEDKPASPVVADNSVQAPQTKSVAPVKVDDKAQPVQKPAVKNEPAKVADSAVIPQMQNPTNAPTTQPLESIKPPKAQKTALPDVKVNPKPKYAGQDSANALESKLATALKNGTQAAEPEAAGEEAQTLAEGETAPATLSKSDAVRQKYQSSRDNKSVDASQPSDEATLAQEDAAANVPMTKIDKIRLKYKRGIKFVENDADEQQLALDETSFAEDEFVPDPQVGPYNEFLPEREIVMYNTGGRMDPFEPLVEDAQQSAGYDRIPDVESLRLVGILQDKQSSRALFEDANGYSYILKTGDRVKNGFLLSISEDRVVFQIRQYGWNRQVALDLEETH